MSADKLIATATVQGIKDKFKSKYQIIQSRSTAKYYGD